jgi:hypothetical protein
MIQATQNNEAAVPLTPNLPKVQSPYFSKMRCSWVTKNCCALNTAIWPLEDEIKVPWDWHHTINILTVLHDKQLLNITVVLVPTPCITYIHKETCEVQYCVLRECCMKLTWWTHNHIFSEYIIHRFMHMIFYLRHLWTLRGDLTRHCQINVKSFN